MFLLNNKKNTSQTFQSVTLLQIGAQCSLFKSKQIGNFLNTEIKDKVLSYSYTIYSDSSMQLQRYLLFCASILINGTALLSNEM